MKREKRSPLVVTPGMTHSTDLTALDAVTFIDGDKVRFSKGRLCKLGGWKKVIYGALSESTSIVGYARCIFSLLKGNERWFVIGTNERLYAFKNSILTNITPFEETPIELQELRQTNYGTLANNPLTTINTSNTITVAHTAHKLFPGDSITLSGASTTNGILNTTINATHIVRSTPTANTYTIIVATAATSSGSGGGASVVEATSIITFTKTAHGLQEGDKINITGATTLAGIPDTEINGLHIIRNVSANNFDIVCITKATSNSGVVGGSAFYQQPIDMGSADRKQGSGYGMGLYGVGLYGIAHEAYDAAANAVFPRLWSMDRFGNNVVMTPGNQSNIYEWIVTAEDVPTPVTAGSAPTEVNYVFVTDNFVVVLGPGDVENKIQWSDLGNISQWVPDADNQAGSNTLRDAGRLMSHLPIRGGGNLIFSDNKIYTMRYIPNSSYIFELKKLWDSDGIIAQNARTSLNGIGYFWGNSGAIYNYNGNFISKIINNSLEQYIKDRLTTNQREKIFLGICRDFNEVWFFYPSSDSENANGFNEIDSYIIHNPDEQWWVTGSMVRTAMEYPNQIDNYQYMIKEDGTLYTHENGLNDDESSLPWEITTNYVRIAEGTRNIEVSGLMVDGIQVGDINVEVYTRPSPRGTERTYGPYTITDATSKVCFRAYGNQRKYRFSGDELDGDFQIGALTEFVKEGAYR